MTWQLNYFLKYVIKACTVVIYKLFTSFRKKIYMDNVKTTDIFHEGDLVLIKIWILSSPIIIIFNLSNKLLDKYLKNIKLLAKINIHIK